MVNGNIPHTINQTFYARIMSATSRIFLVFSNSLMSKINFAEDAAAGQSRSGKIDPAVGGMPRSLRQGGRGEWRSARGRRGGSPTLLPSEASAEPAPRS